MLWPCQGPEWPALIPLLLKDKAGASSGLLHRQTPTQTLPNTCLQEAARHEVASEEAVTSVLGPLWTPVSQTLSRGRRAKTNDPSSSHYKALLLIRPKDMGNALSRCSPKCSLSSQQLGGPPRVTEATLLCRKEPESIKHWEEFHPKCVIFPSSDDSLWTHTISSLLASFKPHWGCFFIAFSLLLQIAIARAGTAGPSIESEGTLTVRVVLKSF